MSHTEPTPYTWVAPAAQSAVEGEALGLLPSARLTDRQADRPSDINQGEHRIRVRSGHMFFPNTGRCVLNPINRSAPNAAGYHPPHTATCVHSLIKAGATIAGMTKMDEFGMG